jgi:hypothetical protein
MGKRFAFRRALAWLVVTMLVATACALGQNSDDQSSQPAPMPEGPHQHMRHGAMQPGSLIDEILQHSLSGTSVEPSSTAADMLMTTKGTWGLMLHGVPFLNAPSFEETFLARVQAYTAGYDREFTLLPRLATALGGEVTFYGKPALLTPLYGAHPLGVVVLLRVRAAGQRH